MASSRILKLRAVGAFLVGLSAIIMSFTMLYLVVLVDDLQEDRRCELELSSDMRRHIGLGLSAVAQDDRESLQHEAEALTRLALQECNP